MIIERYSHVMHIVSNVHGELDENHSAYDVLRATFPAGTVSGAPKIRAMQIINSLEKNKRCAYAGAVGYFGFDGSHDSCITLRTCLLKDGQAHVQAGAGVVADSDPTYEYNETIIQIQSPPPRHRTGKNNQGVTERRLREAPPSSLRFIV